MNIIRLTNTINRFKELHMALHPELKTEDEVVTSINNGYCYVLAYILDKQIKALGGTGDIVRAKGHWFNRILVEQRFAYFDAWMSKGTYDLTDITDVLDEEIDSWTTNRILAEFSGACLLPYKDLSDTFNMQVMLTSDGWYACLEGKMLEGLVFNAQDLYSGIAINIKEFEALGFYPTDYDVMIGTDKENPDTLYFHNDEYELIVTR